MLAVSFGKRVSSGFGFDSKERSRNEKAGKIAEPVHNYLKRGPMAV